MLKDTPELMLSHVICIKAGSMFRVPCLNYQDSRPPIYRITVPAYWTRVVITLSKLHCHCSFNFFMRSTVDAPIYCRFAKRIFLECRVLFIPTHLDLALLFFLFYFPFFFKRKFGFFHCARVFF